MFSNKLMRLVTSCLLILLAGCDSSFRSVNDFNKFVLTSKDFNTIIKEDNYIMRAGVRPPMFSALQEINNMNKESFQRNMKSFSSTVRIDLVHGRIDRKPVLTADVSSQEEYAQTIGILNYSLNKSFFILKSNFDTIYPVTYNFLNGYSSTPDLSYQVIFSAEKLKDVQNVKFCYASPLDKKQWEFYFNLKQLFDDYTIHEIQ